MSYAEILKKNLNLLSGEIHPVIDCKDVSTQNKSSKFYIDAGVYLTHKNLKYQLPKLLNYALKQNCRRIIVIGTSVSDSRRAIELVKLWNAKYKSDDFKLLNSFCNAFVS